MPSKNPARRFQEILDEIAFVETATRAMSFDAFVADPTVRRAVERAYAIISEAAVKLDAQAYDYAPEISWNDIRGLGNAIRHDYGEIDYETLWNIRNHDLAPLKAACAKALAQLRPDDNPTNGNGSPPPTP